MILLPSILESFEPNNRPPLRQVSKTVRRRMRFPFLSIALLMTESCLTETRADDSFVTLQDLRDEDVVKLAYTSKGCFHAHGLELTIRRSKATIATMEEFEFRRTEGRSKPERIMHRLGELTLSDVDVAGLDRFLQRIRAKSDIRGTTAEQVEITLQRNGDVVRTEQFVPASFMEFQKNEVHIADLLVRLKYPTVKLEPK